MYGYRGLGAEAMGPPNDPALGPVASPDVQQQIADIWSYLWEGPGAPSQPIAPVASQTFTGWLNANAGKVAIGAGLFLAVVMFKGRR